MNGTLVIQSHRSPLPAAWLQTCLDSVQIWCEQNHYHYRFLGDELFAGVPAGIMQKTAAQRVIATDLARLLVLQQALSEGFDCVVWIDADVLVFKPDLLVLPSVPFAVGREVWVQRDAGHRLKVYRKVHNAFMLFRRGNSLLDFYLETAERLLHRNEGSMPPQFIGPKLLTALHNIASFPVIETAGMLSPLVMKDIIDGQGAALTLFRQQSNQPLAAANLCHSSVARGDLDDSDVEQVIARLQGVGLW